MERPGQFAINKRAFLSSFVILALLVLSAGVLTRVVPAGSFLRETINGSEVLQPDSFHYVSREAYPVWRWFTAPFETLWGPDSLTVITIILFVLVIGGSFAVLERGGVLRQIIARIVNSFGHRKYLLMGIVVLFFMSLGSIMGIFEEVIPLVPIMITLAYSLGWDSLTGLGMSLLATGFGFSAAISNPFSVAICQRIAGLPLYSGSLFRLAVFASIYLLLMGFLVRYARKVDRDPHASPVYEADQELRAKQRGWEADSEIDPATSGQQARAVVWFVTFLLTILVVMVSSTVVPGLSDYSLPLVALLFLTGSLVSGHQAGLSGGTILKTLWDGVRGMAPGLPLFLMAMSIKVIVSEAGILDTILYRAASFISGATPYGAIFLVFLLILLMELFVGSSSAKAFLIMPIVAPLADLVGLTRQSTVLAFSFGDGFSNVLYPTNPVLLIALGLTVVSYPTWLRWTMRLQLLVLLITGSFMALAVAIRLGPL